MEFDKDELSILNDALYFQYYDEPDGVGNKYGLDTLVELEEIYGEEQVALYNKVDNLYEKITKALES